MLKREHKPTLGSQAFRKVCRSYGLLKVAEALEVERNTVWLWSRARYRPNIDNIYKIEALFGIEARLWTVPYRGRAAPTIKTRVKNLLRIDFNSENHTKGKRK